MPAAPDSYTMLFLATAASSMDASVKVSVLKFNDRNPN